MVSTPVYQYARNVGQQVIAGGQPFATTVWKTVQDG